MKPMLPDHDGGCIANVMGSVIGHFGGVSPLAPARLLPEKELEGAQTVIVLIIDGLGHGYLMDAGRGSALARRCRGHVTSVFPSTTAAAMTTWYTGLPPLGHAIPAWFTYFKEIGKIAIMPPMLTRGTKQDLIKKEDDPFALLAVSPAFDRVKASGYNVIPADYVGKPYNSVMAGKARQLGFNGLGDMLQRAGNVALLERGKKLVMGYWPGLDSTAHLNGLDSDESRAQFAYITGLFDRFLEEELPDLGDTKVIISADHGLTDVPAGNVHWLRDHPSIEECLVMPLCGESRVPFAYVRAGKLDAFMNRVERELGDACEAMTAPDAIASGLFGPGPEHPRFKERAGDVLLQMADGHVLKDLLFGEERANLVAHHGGRSEAEMKVPLIVA